jgi:hypothetical protein
VGTDDQRRINGRLVPVDSGSRASRISAGAAAPRAAKPRPARQKTGLDANRPIDPKTGRIEPQVADPDVVASTSAGWVRLNFVLKPWSSPDDGSTFEERTWAQAYEEIISGYRERGLRLYGLIGAEAMPEPPGDRFRLPPLSGGAEDEWLDQYVHHFVTIVEMFQADVQVFESFNEPDDWHGQDCSWVHPRWFAIMLQRIHTAVRSREGLEEIKLVSGPLQGLESNRNAAVQYLQEVYRTGKEWFRWGQPGQPVPFDGVGYHIYVKSGYDPNQRQREQAIATLCRRYLGAMHQVIRQQEGRDRPLYVSEMGWNSRVERREFERREESQAGCLRTGLKTVCSDPLVELAVWFCLQDFQTETGDMHFGLYRPGEPTPEARKPAFHTFQAFCEGTIEEGEEEARYTNQHVINAFYNAAVALGLANRWSLLTKAGLNLQDLAAKRNATYDGPPIHQLPNLTKREKAMVQEKLDAQVPARALASAGWSPVAAAAVDDALDAEMGLDLSLALHQELITELRQQNDLLRRALEQSPGPDDLDARLNRALLRFALLGALLVLAVSVIAFLLAQNAFP